MELNHREARQNRLKRQKVIRRIVYLAKNVVRCSHLITGQYKKSLSGLTFYSERNLINVKAHIKVKDTFKCQSPSPISTHYLLFHYERSLIHVNSYSEHTFKRFYITITCLCYIWDTIFILGPRLYTVFFQGCKTDNFQLNASQFSYFSSKYVLEQK